MNIDLIPLTEISHRHNVDESDRGAAIVAVPAFPLTGAEWIDVASHIDHLPVFAVNHPGIGAPVCSPTEGITDYADAVVETVVRSGYRHVVMVGNSMGGYVSQAAAVRYPQVVSGLVLVGTKACADSPQQKETRQKVANEVLVTADTAPTRAGVEKLVASDFLIRDPVRMQRIRDMASQATPEGIAWCQHAMAQRPDRLDDLAALNIPVAVIHGVHDVAATAADAQAIATAVGTTLTMVDSAGHLIPLEAPEAVATGIRNIYERQIQS